MHPASALQVCSAYPILPSLVSGHGEGKQRQTTTIMFFSQQTCLCSAQACITSLTWLFRHDATQPSLMRAFQSKLISG